MGTVTVAAADCASAAVTAGQVVTVTGDGIRHPSRRTDGRTVAVLGTGKLFAVVGGPTGVCTYRFSVRATDSAATYTFQVGPLSATYTDATLAPTYAGIVLRG